MVREKWGTEMKTFCVFRSELAEPLGPVEPPEPTLPSQPVEIEIETAEVRKQ